MLSAVRLSTIFKEAVLSRAASWRGEAFFEGLLLVGGRGVLGMLMMC